MLSASGFEKKNKHPSEMWFWAIGKSNFLFLSHYNFWPHYTEPWVVYLYEFANEMKKGIQSYHVLKSAFHFMLHINLGKMGSPC